MKLRRLLLLVCVLVAVPIAASQAAPVRAAKPDLCEHSECGKGAFEWAKQRANELYGSGGLYNESNSVNRCVKFSGNGHGVTQWACYGHHYDGPTEFSWQINLDAYGAVTYHNP